MVNKKNPFTENIGEKYELRGDKIINKLPYDIKGVRIFGVTEKKTNKDYFIVENSKAKTYHQLKTKSDFNRLNSKLYGSAKYKIITPEKLEVAIK